MSNETTMRIGECDVCGLEPRALRKVIAYGIETYACGRCLGDDPDGDIDRDLDFESFTAAMR